MISVRHVLMGLGVAFTAYLAARGLWWTAPVPYPLVIFASFALYLSTTLVCIFWTRPADARGVSRARRNLAPGGLPAAGRRDPGRLPVWAAVLALAVAAIVPSAIAFAVGPASRTAPFATWYLGGIGALMTIVMVRRRPWVAWSGMVVLTIASMAWMGPVTALALGLVGSLVWVWAAQLLIQSMDRAARDTSRLAQLQRAASAWQAAQVVRQRERRVQVQRALAVAGPVLARTVATGGELSEQDRLEARLAEGELRDELRGPRLLDDEVRGELARARRRGASVTVLDEGGLEALDDDELAVIRAQLAETLRSAASERIYIRTSPHDGVAVTVVGRSASSQEADAQGLTDEDTVDLWREIARPQHGVTPQSAVASS